MERTLRILSFIFIGAALVFVWLQNIDGIFVMAVLGASCFFLSMRYEIQARRDRRDAERESAEESDT